MQLNLVIFQMIFMQIYENSQLFLNLIRFIHVQIKY